MYILDDDSDDDDDQYNYEENEPIEFFIISEIIYVMKIVIEGIIKIKFIIKNKIKIIKKKLNNFLCKMKLNNFKIYPDHVISKCSAQQPIALSPPMISPSVTITKYTIY